MCQPLFFTRRFLHPQLNLAHCGVTADSCTARVGTTTATHDGKGEGDAEGCETEPEESRGRLSLATALLTVWRAVGNEVVGGVRL